MPIQQMMLGSGGKTDPVYIDDIFSTDLWESHTDRNEIIANGVKLGNANKGGSVYFNGSDYKDYISIAANSDMQMGTGDFTIEMWIWVDSETTNESCWRGIFSIGGYTDSGGITIYAPRATSPADTVVVILNAVNPTIGSTTDIKDNSWHHVALVKNSGTTSLYIDGTSEGSVSDSNNYTWSGDITIGRDNKCISGGYSNSYYKGFISNLRVTKGQALYTSNFTPATEALTTTSQGATASNVKLLCCQSPDSFWSVTKYGTLNTSSEPHASWTPHGDSGGPVAKAFGPFTGSDGKGGFIWHKRRTGSGGFGWNVICDSSRGANYGIYPNNQNSGGVLTGNPNPSVFCDGGFIWGSENNFQKDDCEMVSWSFAKQTGFVDVVEYTGNNTARDISHSLKTVPGMILLKIKDETSDWVVYHKDAGNQAAGALNSTAVFYTSNSTIWDSTTPTATSFRIGANANTNSTGKDYIAYIFAGGASTAATAVSVDFDGTDDILQTSTSTDYQLGTSSFTVEAWIYNENPGENRCIAEFSQGTHAYYGPLFLYQNDSGATYKFWASSDGSSWDVAAGQSFGAVVAKQWEHFAIVRDGSTFYGFRNGIQKWTFTSSASLYQNVNQITIGRSQTTQGGTPYFEGKISNFRFVKGTALYTSSFKPTNEPLSSVTNTKLLCCNNSSVTGTTTGTVTSTGSPTASTDSPFYDSGNFKFGENKDQQIIACGSHSHASTNAIRIYTGWEPEYIMCKNTDSTGDWLVLDTVRGAGIAGGGSYTDGQYVACNTDSNEGAGDTFIPYSDGFEFEYGLTAANPGNGDKIVWMAIRRPDGYVRKPVTDGDAVFAIGKGRDTTTEASNYVSNFPVDMGWHRLFASDSFPAFVSRKTGGKYLRTDDSAAQDNASWAKFDSSTAYISNNQDDTHMAWMWNRHAGFDCQTYVGNGGTTQSIPHSLGRTPEMIWVKNRDHTDNWQCYHFGCNGGTNPHLYRLRLNTNNAEDSDAFTWVNAPTSTHFTVGSNGSINRNNEDFVAYLFSSVDGVCKLGYYDGQASDLTVTFGFQPRFLMVKRVDDSGDWNYYDVNRGFVSGADEELRINSNSAQSDHEVGDITATGFTFACGGVHDTCSAGKKFVYYAHA